MTLIGVKVSLQKYQRYPSVSKRCATSAPYDTQKYIRHKRRVQRFGKLMPIQA
jgi:hypothetical protein